ncbi:MAG: hypothetical protein LIP12_10265 [Clostridiales bacterium]|nr:hypothetical protein [Clostridiales bacterium]
MKRKTRLAVGAAILMIAGLIGFGIMLTMRDRTENLPSEEAYQLTQKEASDLLAELDAITDPDADDGLESASLPESDTDSMAAAASDSASDKVPVNQTDVESETEQDTEWVLDLLALDDTPVIWVGDSRTVGMQKALGSYTEDVFIGAAGEGYSWLYETGVSQLKAAISEYPGRPVILNMGVNDYENLYNYMVLYDELTLEYPDTVFWFLSVNPVDDEAGLYITNAQIEEFNASLSAAYPDTWLDCYTFLIKADAGTIDGIHYSEEVYRMIYLYVKEEISDRS